MHTYLHSPPPPHTQMALRLGVDSVMCDGSALPYEENVAWTARMAAMAHALVRRGGRTV